jgi:hypothetical protein
MRYMICAVVLLAAATGRVSAECIDVPVTRLARDAEILMLARVDVAPNPAPNQPNFIDGTHVVTVTVKTLWKGNTPRQIELRQNFNAENPPFWTSIGKDLVLSVRRFTPERPLGTPTMPVTSGFTAVACNWRPAESVDLNALGRGRSPND